MSLSSFFGVVDGIERIIEDTCLDHRGDRCEILNSTERGEVSMVLQFLVSLLLELEECPPPSWVLRLLLVALKAF